MTGLAELLVFPFFLLLFRVGAAVMVFPALSDTSISMRIRLLVVVAISFVLFPLVQSQLPTLPARSGDMVMLVFGELVIGLLLGLGARLFLAALSVAGEMISFMSGFQAATLFDPQSGSNTGAPAIFLTLCAGMLIFAMNLHHELIRAIMASYEAFPPGQLPPVDDVNRAVVDIFAQMFALGVRLAAPVVVAGLLTNALFGVMNRLIPQLQVFFISVPVSITLSLLILSVATGAMLQLWGSVVAAKLTVFQVESE